MNFVKIVTLTLLMATTGCAQVRGKMEKAGIITYPGQAGRTIASGSYESYHKSEYKVVSRGPLWNQQFAPGATSLPSKPKHSLFLVDTGRTYIRKETGGGVSVREGYNPYTGGLVMETGRDEYGTKVVEKREPYMIPYSSLPDRGSRRSYGKTVSGHIQLRPLLTAPLHVGR